MVDRKPIQHTAHISGAASLITGPTGGGNTVTTVIDCTHSNQEFIAAGPNRFARRSP